MFWNDINPLDFNNGIYFLPDQVELQPSQPDWGHPGSRQRVIDGRPHGINGAKLLCLLCMRTLAESNQPLRPVWLTYVNHPRKPFFRHEDERSPHAEHQPETDIHKALKEREARTFEAAGALEVNLEMWRPRAKRRPDLYVKGPTLSIAAEVQHSTAPSRTIQARQRSLNKIGDRVVWTTDLNADSSGFLHTVPHLSVKSVKDYRLYLSQERLEINGGAIAFEKQRCGWSDIWNSNTTRCPVTRKAIPCGRMHLYPTFNLHTYSRTPSPQAARFPCGSRLHLDHMLEGVLHGAWLPYLHHRRVTWVPADIYDDMSAERGGTVEEAESGDAPRSDRTAKRACDQRLRLTETQPLKPQAPLEPSTPHGWWLVSNKPAHPNCEGCRRVPGGPTGSKGQV